MVSKKTVPIALPLLAIGKPKRPSVWAAIFFAPMTRAIGWLRKSMKIVEQANFLTIENADLDAASVKSREKLTFDGKTRQINHSKGNRKTFSMNLSNNGQTMTIKSIVYFMTGTPYKVNVQQQAYTNVTEVWNLRKDGRSIAILAKAKSNIWDEERSWKTVFARTN